MTEISHIAQMPGRARDARIIGLVSGAHFISHLYMLVLPPVFAFIKADYAVSYAELGFAIATFNVVSAAFQTPAGFLVDRFGAPRLLIAGLALSAFSAALAGLLPSYGGLIAAFALLGLANTIYHPADYAILSHTIDHRGLGKAFSLHTFFGTLGTAVAPTLMLFLTGIWGWRGAFVGAAAFGFAMAMVLLFNRGTLEDAMAAHPRHVPSPVPGSARPKSAVGWRLLLSPPILRNVAFFVVLSIASGGMQAFSIVALVALYRTPLAVANFALSGYLLLNALGVLAGGIVASRAKRHELVAAVGFIASGALILVVGLVDLGSALLVLMMAGSGFLNGIILPSRDMIVRAATPPGSFGKVFGFVSTGFNISGIIAPLLFGWLMDQAHPRSIFLVIAGFTLLSLPLMTGGSGRRKERVSAVADGLKLP